MKFNVEYLASDLLSTLVKHKNEKIEEVKQYLIESNNLTGIIEYWELIDHTLFTQKLRYYEAIAILTNKTSDGKIQGILKEPILDGWREIFYLKKITCNIEKLKNGKWKLYYK